MRIGTTRAGRAVRHLAANALRASPAAALAAKLAVLTVCEVVTRIAGPSERHVRSRATLVLAVAVLSARVGLALRIGAAGAGRVILQLSSASAARAKPAAALVAQLAVLTVCDSVTRIAGPPKRHVRGRAALVLAVAVLSARVGLALRIGATRAGSVILQLGNASAARAKPAAALAVQLAVLTVCDSVTRIAGPPKRHVRG